MKHTSVVEATHVKVGGQWHKIIAKNGVGPNGELAPPSKGGFSVVTEDAGTIDMWRAEAYKKEDNDTE